MPNRVTDPKLKNAFVILHALDAQQVPTIEEKFINYLRNSICTKLDQPLAQRAWDVLVAELEEARQNYLKRWEIPEKIVEAVDEKPSANSAVLDKN